MQVHEGLLHQARDLLHVVLAVTSERRTVVQPCTYERPNSATATGKKDAKGAAKKEVKPLAKKDAKKDGKAGKESAVAVDAPLEAWHCDVMVKTRLQVRILKGCPLVIDLLQQGP